MKAFHLWIFKRNKVSKTTGCYFFLMLYFLNHLHYLIQIMKPLRKLQLSTTCWRISNSSVCRVNLYKPWDTMMFYKYYTWQLETLWDWQLSITGTRWHINHKNVKITPINPPSQLFKSTHNLNYNITCKNNQLFVSATVFTTRDNQVSEYKP